MRERQREVAREVNQHGKAKAREWGDDQLRGFVLRCTPAGVLSFGVRFRRPDGSHGRKSIGDAAVMNPSEARTLARAALSAEDKAGDTPAEIAQRKRDREEAERKAAEEAAAAAKSITLDTFLSGAYAAFAEVHLKTAAKNIKRVRVNFANLLSRPLASITKQDIEDWRYAKLKTGVQPVSAERELNALRGVLTYAAESGLTAENPGAKVKAIKVEPRKVVRYLSDDEERRLRDALAARDSRIRMERGSANEWRRARGYEELPEITARYVDHVEPAVLLSLNSGLRLGELLKLAWSDLDLNVGTMTVRPTEAKSKKSRVVPLNREASEVLSAWRKQSPGKIVFAGPDDKPMGSFKTAWASVLRSAQIENLRWHDLRHAFASSLVMRGVDLNTLRELLGHADLKMVLRYAHLAPSHLHNAVALLDKPTKPGRTALKAI
ncbi:tyrosine-type recombinase/integrase [Cupriavidus yeoncheonensis]|uniref:tyrosine-type recombinase/integrase n=1 Tax=Cupriavidus yeoncheonensis TaxID=1462994 RepID=UPI001BAB4CE2|nr:tyrosine-type recombinase/integrase [Cupriavidus yeoncheonensis]